MKQIYFLSAFFPSFAGGAEKSILEEFKIYARNGFAIKAVSFDILYNGDKYDFGAVSGENYQLNFKFLLSYSRLAFLFFNRGLVKRILDSYLPQIKNSDFVVLQGPYTPYLSKFCVKNKIPYHYYLRDGTGINLFQNQSRGVRRLRKYLKLLIETPFIIDFRLGNRGALKKASEIIANSDKMAELLFKRFGLKANQVIYPKINIPEIANFTLDPVKQKYITLIGGRDSDKAYEIFLRVAKKMPEYEFLVVEKRDGADKKGNVTFAPRQSNVGKIYEITKVAVSISRWNNEFSGRVGMEAGHIGIPVISSSPINDAPIDGQKVHVLKDIDDVDEWVETIRSFEAKRGIFILNSDFGVRNTIGARAYQIWKDLPYKNGVNIFCRDYRQGVIAGSLAKKVAPGGAFIMKLINALHIYLPFANKINLNKLKIDLFQFFLIRKLKKVNLKNISFVHSWDYLPKVYSFLKVANPFIKIIQDVPMAFTSLLEKQLGSKKKEEMYGNVSLAVDKYILECDKNIDLYIAPSQFVKDSLVFERVSPEKIHIIPFGVDANKFKPVQAPPHEEGRGVSAAESIDTHSINNEIINFCFAGAVNKRKGATYLIEAWKKLNLPNARLNLYGRVYPEVKEWLRDSFKYNIIVHGFADAATELPKNDVYVFPSILEGSAKSVYEAMACGLPVITTINAGSIIEDGVSGFIMPIADAEALAVKIKFFIDHPEKIREMGQAARKRAAEYSWERYAKEIARVYKQ